MTLLLADDLIIDVIKNAILRRRQTSQNENQYNAIKLLQEFLTETGLMVQ